MNLPDLIRLKIRHYLYRDRWMSKRKLHEEFKFRVCIVIRDSHEYVKFNCGGGFGRGAYPLTCYSHNGTGRNINIITRLFGDYFDWYKLPHKYHYSSGLNDPAGYK